MANLTRYKLKVRYSEEDGHYAVGVVRQEGEWVKFDDVKELLNKSPNSASDAIIALRDIVTAADFGTLSPDSVSVKLAREVLQQAHVA